MIEDVPIDVETRFVSRARFLGMKFGTELEVTEHERPFLYGNRALSGPVPFEVRWVLRDSDGGTHLERLGRADVGYFRFAESVVTRMADRRVVSNFGRIRSLLESQKFQTESGTGEVS